MAWDLTYIKLNVNLLDYILNTNPQCSEKRAGNCITINPCPICGHKDDFIIYPETNTFCCFRNDNVGGSIIDFIMQTENYSLGGAVKKCADLAGLTIGGTRSFNNSTNSQNPTFNDCKDSYDYKMYDFTELIKIAHQNCSQTTYYKSRGLTDKTIEKYMLGYHKEGYNFAVQTSKIDIGKENFILKFYKYFLPVLDEDNICRYFITRLDDKSLPQRLISSIKDKTHNPKGLRVQLFNQRYITNPNLANNIIFVVEGIFDALSLEECGLSAIALNSTSNSSTLIKLVQANMGKIADKFFIVIGDNDEAGENMAQKLLTQLENLNIDVINCVLPSEYKDSNEFLVTDKSGFEKFFNRFIKTIAAAPKVA